MCVCQYYTRGSEIVVECVVEQLTQHRSDTYSYYCRYTYLIHVQCFLIYSKTKKNVRIFKKKPVPVDI